MLSDWIYFIWKDNPVECYNPGQKCWDTCTFSLKIAPLRFPPPPSSSQYCISGLKVHFFGATLTRGEGGRHFAQTRPSRASKTERLANTCHIFRLSQGLLSRIVVWDGFSTLLSLFSTLSFSVSVEKIELYCMGSNRHFQLGVRSNLPVEKQCSAYSYPVQIHFNSDSAPLQVACGDTHTALVTGNGHMTCHVIQDRSANFRLLTPFSQVQKVCSPNLLKRNV